MQIARIQTPTTAGVLDTSYIAVPVREQTLRARSLSVFVDLGVPDNRIAQYFRVPERRVASLKRYYGLG